jgi:hypothetical protein
VSDQRFERNYLKWIPNWEIGGYRTNLYPPSTELGVQNQSVPTVGLMNTNPTTHWSNQGGICSRDYLQSIVQSIHPSQRDLNSVGGYCGLSSSSKTSKKHSSRSKVFLSQSGLASDVLRSLHRTLTQVKPRYIYIRSLVTLGAVTAALVAGIQGS